MERQLHAGKFQLSCMYTVSYSVGQATNEVGNIMFNLYGLHNEDLCSSKAATVKSSTDSMCHINVK